jgi:hypothetical protein
VRFLVLVLAATGFGAVSVAALQTVFPEHKASVTAAVHAAGGRVSRFQLSDLNPLRWIYDYEVGEITSPTRKLDFPSSPPIAVGDPSNGRRSKSASWVPAAP